MNISIFPDARKADAVRAACEGALTPFARGGSGDPLA